MAYIHPDGSHCELSASTYHDNDSEIQFHIAATSKPSDGKQCLKSAVIASVNCRGFCPKRWCLQSHSKKQAGEPVFVVSVITLKAVRLLHRMRKKHRVLSTTEVGELVKGA